MARRRQPGRIDADRGEALAELVVQLAREAQRAVAALAQVVHVARKRQPGADPDRGHPVVEQRRVVGATVVPAPTNVEVQIVHQGRVRRARAPRVVIVPSTVVVTPARVPVSISSRLTHSLRVCGTQPILGAMDSMAAHSEGYSPRCSRTMRTARSRTSGENLFELLMAQSSQRKEPPQNPGRFKLNTCAATFSRSRLICALMCKRRAQAMQDSGITTTAAATVATMNAKADAVATWAPT